MTNKRRILALAPLSAIPVAGLVSRSRFRSASPEAFLFARGPSGIIKASIFSIKTGAAKLSVGKLTAHSQIMSALKDVTHIISAGENNIMSECWQMEGWH